MTYTPKINDRVVCTFQDGTEALGFVQFWRMAPPYFNSPESISVFLDKRKDDERYGGTLVPANRVRKVEDGKID